MAFSCNGRRLPAGASTCLPGTPGPHADLQNGMLRGGGGVRLLGYVDTWILSTHPLKTPLNGDRGHKATGAQGVEMEWSGLQGPEKSQGDIGRGPCWVETEARQQTPRLVAWRLGSFPRSHTSFPSFFWPGVDDVVYTGLRSRPWPTFHYDCTLCGCYAFESPGVLRTRQLIPPAKGGGGAFRGTLGIHATRRALTRPCVYLCRPGAIQKQGLV